MDLVSDPAIGEAYRNIKSGKSGDTWVIYGYKSQQKLGVIETGSSDWNSLISHFSDDKILYCYVKLSTGDDLSKRTKFVFVCWVGQKVGTVARARVSVHKGPIKGLLEGISVELYATTKEDLDYRQLLDRVTVAGGAQYDSSSGSRTSSQQHHDDPHSHSVRSDNNKSQPATQVLVSDSTKSNIRNSQKGSLIGKTIETKPVPSPNTARLQKASSSSSSNFFSSKRSLTVGVGSLQGKRSSMEDRDLALKTVSGLNPHWSLFGVFDGHGGDEAAQFSADKFPAHFTEHLSELSSTSLDSKSKSQIEELITKACGRVDEEFLEECAMCMYESGTTACCVLVDSNSKNLVCINIGDSRAVLSGKDGKARPISVDHKPRLDKERSRIEAAGFSVDGDGRINGLHSFSRAIGDADMKGDFTKSQSEQAIICVPEFDWVDFGGGNGEFVVIACDGLWDVMKNEEAVEWVRERIEKGKGSDEELKTIAKDLAEHAIAIGSTDNVSICIVLLPA
eukprot:TRINITY_DN234_c1_g1_i1.p1 TRINITY_DN234_c1_g1~~TRINITY_DN234_c1_g1_i1.p1  ORF type:complete len:507 (-),score=126.82 TRINITY_DN234_c1_g1_i1:43-1563(-)